MATYSVEVTDTFGGEANYSWVRRYEIKVPEGAKQREIVKAAKAVAGWTGTPCVTDSFGDEYHVRPRNGDCVIMFVSYQEEA